MNLKGTSNDVDSESFLENHISDAKIADTFQSLHLKVILSFFC